MQVALGRVAGHLFDGAQVQNSPNLNPAILWCPCLDAIDLGSCSAAEQQDLRQRLNVPTTSCGDPSFGVCRDNTGFSPTCAR